MKSLAVAFLIALTILPGGPASRAVCAETSATLSRQVTPSDPDIVPINEDPNAPTAPLEERIRRQRALIQKRMEQRQKQLHALMEQRQKQLDALKDNTAVASAAQASSSTQSMPAEKMMPGLAELKQEFECLRAQLKELVDKAGPAIKEAVAQPEARSYRVDVEAKLINNQTLQLTGYGEDQVVFSAPLMVPNPANKSTMVGSFELSMRLQPLDAGGKVQAQYNVTMDVPMLQTYNSGGGNTSTGQTTFRSGMTGKVVLKGGESKMIAKVGENTVRVTVTPE